MRAGIANAKRTAPLPKSAMPAIIELFMIYYETAFNTIRVYSKSFLIQQLSLPSDSQLNLVRYPRLFMMSSTPL